MSEINTIFSEVSLAQDLEDQKDATDLLVDITDMSFGTDIALLQVDHFLCGGLYCSQYSEVAKM